MRSSGGWRMRSRVPCMDRRLMRRSVPVRSPERDRGLVAITRAASYSQLWLLIAGALAACGGQRGQSAAARGIAAIVIAAAVANDLAKLLVRRRCRFRHSRPALIRMLRGSFQKRCAGCRPVDVVG